MNTRFARWMLVVLLGLPAGTTGQETLTGAAAREKERRVNQGETRGKSYTDDDLKRLPRTQASPGNDAEGTASTSSSDEGASSSDASSENEERERWRTRVVQGREDIQRFEAQLKELEGRIQEARSESMRPTRIGEANREASIARDVTALLGQVDETRKLIEDAKQNLEDLIEEARVAGVPYSQLE